MVRTPFASSSRWTLPRGSFDSVAAWLRETSTSLSMTSHKTGDAGNGARVTRVQADDRSLAPLGTTAAGSRLVEARKAPSLLVFHVHVLGVDHAFVFLLALTVAAGVAARSRARRWTARCRSWCGLRRLVHLFGQLVRSRG